jgi:hypothetical protein
MVAAAVHKSGIEVSFPPTNGVVEVKAGEGPLRTDAMGSRAVDGE